MREYRYDRIDELEVAIRHAAALGLGFVALGGPRGDRGHIFVLKLVDVQPEPDREWQEAAFGRSEP